MLSLVSRRLGPKWLRTSCTVNIGTESAGRKDKLRFYHIRPRSVASVLEIKFRFVVNRLVTVGLPFNNLQYVMQ